jgi:hypothetical protein
MKTAVTTYDPANHHDEGVGYYAPVVGRDLALFAGNMLVALGVSPSQKLALVAHDGSTRLLAEAFIEAHGRGRIVAFDKRKTEAYETTYPWKARQGEQPEDANVDHDEIVVFLDDYSASGCAIEAAVEVLGRVDYAFVVKGHNARISVEGARTYVMKDFYENGVRG